MHLLFKFEFAFKSRNPNLSYDVSIPVYVARQDAGYPSRGNSLFWWTAQVPSILLVVWNGWWHEMMVSSVSFPGKTVFQNPKEKVTHYGIGAGGERLPASSTGCPSYVTQHREVLEKLSHLLMCPSLNAICPNSTGTAPKFYLWKLHTRNLGMIGKISSSFLPVQTSEWPWFCFVLLCFACLGFLPFFNARVIQ